MGRLNFQRTSALIKKEFFQMARDPASFLIAVVMPIILLFVFGTGISLDMNNIKLGLAMEDTSPLSQSFAESLRNSRFFTVTAERNREPLNRMLDNGEIHGYVVIPEYFSRDFFNPGRQAPIQVIADGSVPNTAGFVHNYVRGAWVNWEAIRNQDGSSSGPNITAEPRYWYNEDLQSSFFLVPGTIAVIMTLIGTMLTAVVVSREWEKGTMECLLATPATVGELMVSKVIPNFCLGMGSLFFCTLIAIFIYGVPFRGSVLILGLVSAIFLLAALAIGLFISTITKDQFFASQMSIVSSYLPSFILSGFIFEITSMPYPIQLITYIVPARYYVTALHTIFLAGDVWRLTLFTMGALLTFALVIYSLTYAIFRKRLD
jgi:ABC-2 type transport system permease protein